MPSILAISRAPKAKRKKVWVHTFYLLQPFMQFFALIAVLVIFTRCSPLAPSTDKASALKTSGPVAAENSDIAVAAVLEEDFLKNLKEVSTAEISVVSESDHEQEVSAAPHADAAIQEAEIQSLFAKRNKIAQPGRAKAQVLFIPLDHASRDAFFVNNFLRVDLSERLKSHTKEKARRLLFKNILESVENQKLDAKAMLVLPDATMNRVNGAFDDLQLTVKVSVSISGNDKAFLEIRRVEDQNPTPDNAALLDAALKEATQLSILLE